MRKLLSMILALALLATTAIPALADVELRFMWWGGEARHEATLAAIDRYTQDHPGITISAEYSGYTDYYQKLATQLAGRSAPDIIQMDTMWFQDLMRQGDMFCDIESLPIDISPLDQETVDTCRRGGVLVGLPTGVIVENMLILNKEFFDRHNLDVSVQLDWDTFVTWGKQVNAASPEDYLGAKAEQYVDMYMLQKIGGPMVSDDYEIMFSVEQATEMYEFLLELYESNVCMPYDEAIVMDDIIESAQWLNGHIGTEINASSTFTTAVQNSGFEVGYMQIPLTPGASNTAIEIRPAQILSINKASANVEESAKFVEWFLTAPEAIEILRDCRGVPANEAARKMLEEKKIFDPIVVEVTDKSMDVAGVPMNEISLNAELIKIYDDTLAMVAYKQISPEEAAKQLYAEYEAKLAELKG